MPGRGWSRPRGNPIGRDWGTVLPFPSDTLNDSSCQKPTSDVCRPPEDGSHSLISHPSRSDLLAASP